MGACCSLWFCKSRLRHCNTYINSTTMPNRATFFFLLVSAVEHTEWALKLFSQCQAELKLRQKFVQPGSDIFPGACRVSREYVLWGCIWGVLRRESVHNVVSSWSFKEYMFRGSPSSFHSSLTIRDHRPKADSMWNEEEDSSELSSQTGCTVAVQRRLFHTICRETILHWQRRNKIFTRQRGFLRVALGYCWVAFLPSKSFFDWGQPKDLGWRKVRGDLQQEKLLGLRSVPTLVCPRPYMTYCMQNWSLHATKAREKGKYLLKLALMSKWQGLFFA